MSMVSERTAASETALGSEKAMLSGSVLKRVSLQR